MIALPSSAYLTRPEGLILPVALLGSLLLLSMSSAARCRAAKRWCAIGVLVAGPILAAGPFMIMKGGISTKPSILRVLGLGRAAPAMAIERERPLDPDQTTIMTISIAARAVVRAIDGATGVPLLLLAPLGVAATWSSPMRRKHWLLLGTIIGLSSLAMIRLHAMSGYCTPRHAMVVAWILIPASAAGLNRLVGLLAAAAGKLKIIPASVPAARDRDPVRLAGLLPGSVGTGGRLADRPRLPRLSAGRRMAGFERATRRSRARPQGLLALLRRASKDTRSRPWNRAFTTPTCAG